MCDTLKGRTMLIPGQVRKLAVSVAAGLAALWGFPGAVSAQSAPTPPKATYWVYVGAESADLMHRIRFGPQGTAVEKTIPVGELAAEMEGPHGLAISRDARYLHMTTGHGFPDGKYWRYELGPDTLVGKGALLGNFPASIDISPDGLYAIAANFNLHGDMVPSSHSVVFTPTQTEVTRIITCTMPHGSRIDPSGRFHYSGCMMDDQLVEIDTRSFAVSRRFSVAKGKEGPLKPDDRGQMAMHTPEPALTGRPAPEVDPADVGYGGMRHTMTPNSCSPTWAQPSADGTKVFVACNKSDEILEVDREAWAVSRRFATGRGPYNLAVTPDGRLLIATLKQGGGVELFDLASGTSVAKLKTSTTVTHGVVVSPDSRYAFVSSEGVGADPGKVDVYDLTARALVGTVDVGQQASGIAFWKMEPAP
jgi:DNA-binding beta-propeller fold protein YncE